MDGWMDGGWIDGWMDGWWMDGWMVHTSIAPNIHCCLTGSLILVLVTLLSLRGNLLNSQQRCHLKLTLPESHSYMSHNAVKHSNGGRYKWVFKSICPACWQSISVTRWQQLPLRDESSRLERCFLVAPVLNGSQSSSSLTGPPNQRQRPKPANEGKC